jgi:ABC-type branched-subunit amino acid transport system ATPase component
MNPLALETRQISKQFPDGTYALQNIEWSVQEGETMALIGESGSGKTTLLRILNRLAEPTAGTIFIQGNPAGSQDPIQPSSTPRIRTPGRRTFPTLDHQTKHLPCPSIIRLGTDPATRTGQQAVVVLSISTPRNLPSAIPLNFQEDNDSG